MENEQKENRHSINIEIPAELAEGVYTNLTVVSHSQGEFVVDFVRMLPGNSKAVVKSRVVMNPENLKRTLSALQDNLMKYEAQFGTVQLPERKQGPMRITPFKGEA